MMKHNNKKSLQARDARLPVVAELYKKGYSLRKIKTEVDARFNSNVSTRTLANDVKVLLDEWRTSRLESIDDYVTLELSRIDDIIVELWGQWEKSKENYLRERNKRVGEPVPADNAQPGGGEQTEIQTVRRENSTENVVALGNPSYMAEIRQQLIERRKLLGLYAPEKKELSGSVTTRVEEMSNEDIQKELAKIREARVHKC